MKIKSQKDFWSGLMFMVVGISFAWGSLFYSMGASARPGPGYFPFGLGVLMSILGAVVLFKALTIEVEGGDKIGEWAWKPLGIITLAVGSFGWLLPTIGMVISLPILVCISALAGDEFHWGEALANAAVLLVGCWVIFIWGLKLTIPLLPKFAGG